MKKSRAFTLVEMLVVIAIISIIVLIAVPAFRVMTGGRSTESAANNLAALIGRARTEAIGLQRASGVLFFMDQATDRVGALVVREVPPPWNSTAPPGTVYLDMAPNGDFTILPPGVMLNTLDDQDPHTPPPPPGVRLDDGYIGFNPVYQGPTFSASIVGASSIAPRCGGVILFDGVGRIAVRPYRLVLYYNGVTTELAKALTYDRDFKLSGQVPIVGKTIKGGVAESYSSIGFVLFDMPSFRESNGGSNTETDYAASYAGAEKTEEDWIDQNSTPYLISRHSGALLRTR